MFHFKQFSITDEISAMKIGTDGVILGAWALQDAAPRHIIDVGTGTGLIALMLAQRFPSAKITAIEINSEASREAVENIARSPWANRINVINADFNCYKPEGQVDAIVSNPPFFDESILSPDHRRTTARHESTLTLDNLIVKASQLLLPNGRLSMIAPARRSDDLIYRCAINHLDTERITTLSSKPSAPCFRVLLQARKGLCRSYESNHIDIHTPNSLEYTETYKSLTRAFYLPETFNRKNTDNNE